MVATSDPELPASIRRTADLIRLSPYRAPWWPYPKQLLFMSLSDRHAMYGGQAFGGKSVALLMDALLHAHVPGYAAVLFRRTYPELNDPGGLIPMSHEWLTSTDAMWNQQSSRWTFPVGKLPVGEGNAVASPHSTLSFKHLQHDKDALRAGRGPTYQWQGWDELTTFTENQYRKPQSRLRRPAHGPLSRVPIRARAGTNPGGEGHDWVREHFIEQPWHWIESEGRFDEWKFLPASIDDNLRGDREGYRASLEASLDPVELARMLEGNWDVVEGGEVFDRGSVVIVQPDEVPVGLTWVRAWDTAGAKRKTSKYTVGVLMGSTGGRPPFWLAHADRFRETPGPRDARMRERAEMDRGDGRGGRVLVEKGGGDAGLKQAEDHIRLFSGFDIRIVNPSGDKVTRAQPLARQWNAGNVRLVSGPWVGPLLSEFQSFRAGCVYSDQVDAAAHAFNELCDHKPSHAAAREDIPQRPPRKRAPPERLFGATVSRGPAGRVRGLHDA